MTLDFLLNGRRTSPDGAVREAMFASPATPERVFFAVLAARAARAPRAARTQPEAMMEAIPR